MNKDVLFEYLARRMHTHVRYCDGELKLIRLYTVRRDLDDVFPGSDGLIETLFQPVEEPRMLVINNLLTYTVVPVEDCFCLIGPVGVCADCRTQIHLPELVIPETLVQNVYKDDSNRLIRNSVFLYNLFAAVPMEELECLNRNCSVRVMDDSMQKASQSIFYHEEYGEKHNPYEAEVREMSAIEHGDLRQLRESWKEDFSGSVGTLSSDPIRDAKYLCIVNISLSARAAIRGGLPYELAYCLADAYCQQIDNMGQKDMLRLENVIRNIQITYTELVSQQKTNPAAQSAVPILVSRAKEYIFSHLHGKLTVTDVADALETHPNYLNRIFKESEGLTVHDYILREKTNLARNMLVYSDHSYSEIASILGFASQSHMGNTFKKITGSTPREYRDAYRKSRDRGGRK